VPETCSHPSDSSVFFHLSLQIIKFKHRSSVEVSREVVLEVNTEKTARLEVLTPVKIHVDTL
jgi:hypothetical protein